MYKNFEETEVWKKAHRLTLDIYALTKDFPKEELYTDLRINNENNEILS